ncbi:ZEB2-regulated ABC transporter 1 [Fusarium oxysporum f. sp. albedinis]|nr:ZEB2-regulated ABC transporter 1 [Fusarium oxysporum f. sp. albedinis]
MGWMGDMDTSSLTWSDKYFPDGESYTSVSHDKGFHAACVEIVGDNLSAKGFLESCTWNILDRGFHDSFTQPPPSFVALRTGRLKSSLALELMHAISNRLPIEICERVATYCLSDKTPPGCLATSGFWWPRERNRRSQLRQAPVNHSYERERHEDFGGRAQFLVKDAEVTSGRQHSLLPPVSWTKRRTRWIKESIAADLRQAINGGLPEEICQYIANFCMCERACLILRELWLDPNRPNCWIKSLFIGRNNSIWAKNMEVEGLRYVRSLSTRRLTQQDALVFETRYRKRGARNRPEACLIIYYSEDHGGIREVIITEDNELPSLNMEPGLSWSISRHQDTLLQFVLRYDVSSPILSYDMRSQIGIGHQATLSDSRPNS